MRQLRRTMPVMNVSGWRAHKETVCSVDFVSTRNRPCDAVELVLTASTVRSGNGREREREDTWDVNVNDRIQPRPYTFNHAYIHSTTPIYAAYTYTHIRHIYIYMGQLDRNVANTTGSDSNVNERNRPSYRCHFRIHVCIPDFLRPLPPHAPHTHHTRTYTYTAPTPHTAPSIPRTAASACGQWTGLSLGRLTNSRRGISTTRPRGSRCGRILQRRGRLRHPPRGRGPRGGRSLPAIRRHATAGGGGRARGGSCRSTVDRGRRWHWGAERGVVVVEGAAGEEGHWSVGRHMSSRRWRR